MARYVKGIGYVTKTSIKFYYCQYLKREKINRKEYLKFLAILKTLEEKQNMVAHQKSVVEKILLKYH